MNRDGMVSYSCWKRIHVKSFNEEWKAKLCRRMIPILTIIVGILNMQKSAVDAWEQSSMGNKKKYMLMMCS